MTYNYDSKHAVIATLPKSGTWFSHLFFWCYNELLAHSEDYLSKKYTPNLIELVKDKKVQSASSCHALNLPSLYICHVICPGFYELKDPLYEQWRGLQFPLPYNGGESYIKSFGEWDKVSPLKNKSARIIYLCRNPLDHFVSYYHNAMNHVDINHRNKFFSDGTMAPISDVKDFTFEFGALYGFIKHYYTFKQMQAAFPDQIKIVSYEELTTNPSLAFKKILSFFDAPVDTELKEKLFADCLNLCSKESLSTIETQLGRSLVGNQIGQAKHIRDGKIGKWRDNFSSDDLVYIECAFNLFDFSLKDFPIALDSEILANIDENTRMNNIAKFYRQQINLNHVQLSLLKLQLQQLHRTIPYTRDPYLSETTEILPMRYLTSEIESGVNELLAQHSQKMHRKILRFCKRVFQELKFIRAS